MVEAGSDDARGDDDEQCFDREGAVVAARHQLLLRDPGARYDAQRDEQPMVAEDEWSYLEEGRGGRARQREEGPREVHHPTPLSNAPVSLGSSAEGTSVSTRTPSPKRFSPSSTSMAL